MGLIIRRTFENISLKSTAFTGYLKKVSLEETMVAIQKAQIGFQATLHARNRMVQAYTDILNMQV